jgi:hypothetical protein
VYDRNVSTYSQTPKLFALKHINGKYIPTQPLIIANTDKVSFGISAVDRYTGSTNNNGIYEADLYDNEEPVMGFQLDSISYDETRYLNAHIDHKLKVGGGPYVEHLSRLPGYPPGVYKDIMTDGVISLADDSIHQIRIVVKDAYNNASILEFQIKAGVIKSHSTSQESSSYFERATFHPGYMNVFETNNVQLLLDENALYDSVRFVYSKKNSPTANSISDLHSIHTNLVPVHDSFTVRLKPKSVVADDVKDKVVVKWSWGSKTDVVKASQTGEWFSAKFRNFGNFQLLVDNIPPTITAIGIRENANLSKSSQIIFVPKDDNEVIKNFRAELDGKWLRFTNDKGSSFIYKFDEMCPAGNHELRVHVQDEAGNIAEKVFHFTR